MKGDQGTAEAGNEISARPLSGAEIARLYRDKLHDSNSAMVSLHTALVSREWQVEDETIIRLRLTQSSPLTARTLRAPAS